MMPVSSFVMFHLVIFLRITGIHRTSGLLTKLTQLVKRQGLFDDPTDEINNLIFRIKEDLGDLNGKCDKAQDFVDEKKRQMGPSNQYANHNTKVVSHLKTELLHKTKDFKSVLEMRSSKMKGQQQRKVALTGTGALSPMKQFAANSAGIIIILSILLLFCFFFGPSTLHKSSLF